MKTHSTRLAAAVVLVVGWLAAPASAQQTAPETSPAPAKPQAAESPSADWSADPVWYDGLVEKATYDATRVVYGQPRPYEAIFLTNKEQHDAATMTKDADGRGETVEVWKHNQIEVIPTPNYDYKYVTTSHLTTAGLDLTRLDVSSQEFCGTSFKQYAAAAGGAAWDYFGFSYMPEQGRAAAAVAATSGRPVVAFNALPLYLRGYDFAGRGTAAIDLLPDQKSNRATSPQPVAAEVRHAGETDGGHRLEVVVGGEVIGTFHMAADRGHVMTRYDGADGQAYALKKVERVDYWSTNGK